MKGIRRTFTQEITPTVEEMGHLFAEMDDDEQAQMFAVVAELAARWGGTCNLGQDHQWCSVGEQLAKPDMALALHVLRQIVEFADEYIANPEEGSSK